MDSSNITCGVVLVVFILGVVILVRNQNEAARRLREAREAYNSSLERLKQYPHDPDLRQGTLELGRRYSNLTRNKTGVSLFDEVALSNDISAACAAAGQSAGPVSTLVAPPVIAERLDRLKALLDTGTITQAEYRDKRVKLLDEI